MAPSMPELPTEPGTVTLTAEERSAGKWSRENMQRAVELMHRDGLLVIASVADKTELLALKEAMLATAADEAKKKTDPAQYNHGIKSNYLMSPPLSTDRLRFSNVYQNPFVIQIAEAYLGTGLHLPFITANVAIAKTTDRQPIHKDCSWVHPTAPHMIISNHLLSDFKPENGSTEFWLGSHAQTSAVEQLWRSKDSLVPTCDIIPALIEERRQTRPPCQVTVPFGSILLRDVRTWHCGMPNPSDEDRIMVAVAYSAPWFPTDRRFLAPESARGLLTGNPKVTPLCDFVPDEEWDEICQKWGKDEPMFLQYGPKTEGWSSLAHIPPELKVINPNYNPAANG